MKIDDIKKLFEEDESLKYALATNLAKYGRPQSKKSDKPSKLTKGLEKGREKYVKDLKKAGLDEDKGRDMAREFISKMRDAMRSLSDDELDTFRKDIAQAFDLNMNESVNEASRRATDFYGDSKHGKSIDLLLKGKWDSKKVESFLEKLGGGNDVKYARIIDFISGAVGLNIRKYKNIGEQLPDLMKQLEVLYKDFLTESVNEDEGTLNKIADMLSRKFDNLRFDVNTMSDRIDVRGSQQDLANFGDKLHGKKIFDYEVFATDDDDRGEIVRIVKSDSISRG